MYRDKDRFLERNAEQISDTILAYQRPILLRQSDTVTDTTVTVLYVLLFCGFIQYIFYDRNGKTIFYL